MKLLKVLVAAAVLAAMVTPAIAEDRLALNGEMRVGGWYLDDGGDKTDTYAEQRLRIGGRLSVAEGVSLTFRTDFSEQAWGSNALGRTAWQLDRAHLDITKGMLHVRAGQQYYGLGSQFAVDTQDTGIVFDFATAVPVSIAYISNGNNGDDADNHIIGVRVPFTNDNFSVTAFAANAKDRGTAVSTTTAGQAVFADLVAAEDAADAAYDKAAAAAYDADLDAAANAVAMDLAGEAAETAALAKAVAALDENTYADAVVAAGMGEDVYVYGLDFATKLDAINLSAGLAIFDGDFVDALNIDAMGTQFTLDVNTALDAATVGAKFYYAQGADDNEVQMTYLGNGFNGYDPANYGPLENENLFAYERRVFDFTGDHAGVVGGQLYASVPAGAATVTASAAYLEPEEDDNTGIDSDLVLNGGLSFGIMDNVTMAAQVQYIDTDAPGAEEKFAAGTRLYVNF